MRPLARACVLLILVLGITACSSSSSTALQSTTAPVKMLTIGYAAPDMIGNQPDMQNSFVHAATAKGWNVLTTSSNGDPQKQAAQITHFIALHVNAIVAVPEDSKAICASVAAAQRAGILFYTLDRAPEGCKVNMVVASNNQLAGQQAAEALVERLKEKYKAPKGKLLELTGNAAQNIVQLRSSGFDAVLKQYPDIQLITKSGNWNAADGQTVVHDVLTANPDLDGIFLHSDAIYTEGTLAALREGGRYFRRNEKGHMLVAGIDGSPACVNAIKNGYADQCSNQAVLDFSMIVNWIERELNGQAIAAGAVTQQGALWSPAGVTLNAVGPELLLSTTSVTARNVDDPGLWANQ